MTELMVMQEVHDALQALLRRCQQREALRNARGKWECTRSPRSVSALFAGPSGTGKTRAAGWLAKGMGVPLHRFEVAAAVSRYVGETEKSLARLFAEAGSAKAVLLLEEADALFGPRAAAGDAEGRFADGHMGYLLESLEAFDGLVLLTGKALSQFDAAVIRRLDAVIEFVQPDSSRGVVLSQT
jgi:SpoVK/Ycf46/Vps4 family AAA+-type ATPase